MVLLASAPFSNRSSFFWFDKLHMLILLILFISSLKLHVLLQLIQVKVLGSQECVVFLKELLLALLGVLVYLLSEDVHELLGGVRLFGELQLVN